jgi:hypothetical protein
MGSGSSLAGSPARWRLSRCSSSLPSSMMVRSAPKRVSGGADGTGPGRMGWGAGTPCIMGMLPGVKHVRGPARRIQEGGGQGAPTKDVVEAEHAQRGHHLADLDGPRRQAHGLGDGHAGCWGDLHHGDLPALTLVCAQRRGGGAGGGGVGDGMVPAAEDAAARVYEPQGGGAGAGTGLRTRRRLRRSSRSPSSSSACCQFGSLATGAHSGRGAGAEAASAAAAAAAAPRLAPGHIRRALAVRRRGPRGRSLAHARGLQGGGSAPDSARPACLGVRALQGTAVPDARLCGTALPRCCSNFIVMSVLSARDVDSARSNLRGSGGTHCG